MSQYVVRQPIKDAQQNIFGYEILFKSENDGLYNQNNDSAVADSISSFLMQNNSKIFKDKITFMTFTPNLLFKNTPKIFKQKDLVIQIEDNLIIHPLAQTLIQRYKRDNYAIAVNDFQFAPRYFSMMEYIDYIKVNFSDPNEKLISNIIAMAKGLNKKCIAYGINDERLFKLANEMGVHYYQGSYVADVMMTKANKTQFLQSNFFQLVVAVTRDEPDMDEIESIISRDAALTYAILKMVNSVYFALRRRTSSIKQALVILGVGQLKQWVYLLSFDKDGNGVSEEVLKMSFLRASFCAELSDYIETMPISKGEAYIMGMFSTLHYLVDAPLEEILDEIPLVDEIKDALLSHSGKCGQLFDLVIFYETANWNKITEFADALELPASVIAQVYFNCVEEVNIIWDKLTNQYHEDEEEYTPSGISELEQYDYTQSELPPEQIKEEIEEPSYEQNEQLLNENVDNNEEEKPTMDLSSKAFRMKLGKGKKTK